jgi:hypothetical protein
MDGRGFWTFSPELALRPQIGGRAFQGLEAIPVFSRMRSECEERSPSPRPSPAERVGVATFCDGRLVLVAVAMS